MDNQLKFELGILVIVLVIALRCLLSTQDYYRVQQVFTKRNSSCKTVICIGSGGHTTEMLQLIQNINFKNYAPRYYIMAKSDETSLNKVKKVEQSRNSKIDENYFIVKIPRSRSVGQSYITSVFTTIISILYSVPLMLWLRPDVILCNGPGTCIPICIISFMLKCAFICDTKIVFIESFCRTQTFSLTGKILTYIADNFIVQWPSLKIKLKRADYIGQLL